MSRGDVKIDRLRLATPLERGRAYTTSVRTPSMTVTWTFAVGERNDGNAVDVPRTTPVPVLRSLDAACPAGADVTYTDVDARSPDAAAIACVGLWSVAQGNADGEFQPDREITRAQLATFIANVVTTTGGSLPARAPDAFDDDAGNPHAANIDRIAAAGLISGTKPRTFSPDATVNRAQLATFLTRAYAYRAGAELVSTRDWFADDDANPHVASIDRAAEAGLLTATNDGTFGPDTATTRTAMASAVARLLDLLVAEDLAPAPPAR